MTEIGLTKADKLRIAAARLIDEINHLRRPLSQNGTPKRVREYNGRVHDGNNLERVRNALFALADAHEAGTIPAELVKLTTKKEILELVRCKLDTASGYYCANPTDEYVNMTPQAKALQEFLAASGKGKDPEAARKFEIAKLENEIRFCDIPGFFPTPALLADLLVEYARIPASNCSRHFTTVLDPGAGKGDLIEAVLRKHEGDVEVKACEIVPRLQDILSLKGFDVIGSDFLELFTEFDRVIMNPPFENGTEMKHIKHAYNRCLKPGGILVSIISPGPFFRTDKACVEFRQWAEARHAEIVPVDSGAFTGAQAFRQTGTKCSIIVIEKPLP